MNLEEKAELFRQYTDLKYKCGLFNRKIDNIKFNFLAPAIAPPPFILCPLLDKEVIDKISKIVQDDLESKLKEVIKQLT